MPRAATPKLIVFAGLPASGKSSVAHELSLRINGVWLRIDSMDQAIWRSGTAPRDLQDWTYRAAQAVAEDNLRLGRDVIADCVNDCKAARDGWQDAGERAGAHVVWVETVCSDAVEHRRRVETREVDVPGLHLPDWRAVTTRDYDVWDRARLIVDTAHRDRAACVEEIVAVLGVIDR
jgi:predicted kinase